MNEKLRQSRAPQVRICHNLFRDIRLRTHTAQRLAAHRQRTISPRLRPVSASNRLTITRAISPQPPRSVFATPFRIPDHAPRSGEARGSNHSAPRAIHRHKPQREKAIQVSVAKRTAAHHPAWGRNPTRTDTSTPPRPAPPHRDPSRRSCGAARIAHLSVPFLRAIRRTPTSLRLVHRGPNAPITHPNPSVLRAELFRESPNFLPHRTIGLWSTVDQTFRALRNMKSRPGNRPSIRLSAHGRIVGATSSASRPSSASKPSSAWPRDALAAAPIARPCRLRSAAAPP